MTLRALPPYSTLSDTALLLPQLRVEPGSSDAGSASGDAAAATVPTLSVDECLDRIGTGRFHVIAVIICGLGNAADAVELMSIGYIMPALAGGVSAGDKALLSASVFLGMLVGGLISGRLSDRLGRKAGMCANSRHVLQHSSTPVQEFACVRCRGSVSMRTRRRSLPEGDVLVHAGDFTQRGDCCCLRHGTHSRYD